MANNIEEMIAFQNYFSMATDTLKLLNDYHDMFISRERAKQRRDDVKVMSDKEIKVKCSSMGRFFREVGGRELERKNKYELYDLLLAHMSIQGLDSINSIQFSKSAFDYEIYKKYFKESFEKFEEQNIEDEYNSQLSAEQKKNFAQTIISARENLIPKYGQLPKLEEEAERE